MKRRALDNLPRAFGLHAIEGSAVIAADKAGGYAITFNNPHALHGLVKLRIEDNGVIGTQWAAGLGERGGARRGR